MTFKRNDESWSLKRTDDDLPPDQSRSRVGRPSGNGRAAAGPSYARPPPNSVSADQQLRRLELDAYTAVLQAFGAQSEVITWAKLSLMSDLRKELEVPDEQHRELLRRVSENELIRSIRENKRIEVAQLPNTQIPLLLEPSPSQLVTLSRKKQKTAHVSQTPPVLSLPPPPVLLKPAPNNTPHAQSPAPNSKRVPVVGLRGKKNKGGRQPAAVPALTPKGAGGTGTPLGRGSNLGRGPPPARTVVPSDTAADNYVGRRVKTRWPDDNTFYEAVISDYDADKGLHALVYDMGTSHETWEWVSLKEMSENDMKWVGGPPISLSNKGGLGGPSVPVGRGSGRGMKRGASARGGSVSGVGRARGGARGQAAAPATANVPIAQTRSWRGPSANENGLERKGRTVQIPHIDPFVKEAGSLNEIVDLEKLEVMRRKFKAHEETLRSSLAELGESSEEAESDDGTHGPPSHTRSVDRERVNRSLPGSRDRRDDTDDEEDTAGDGRGEGSDGEPMVEEGGGVSDGEQNLVEEEDEDG